jgi:hypothetical protein
MAIKYISWAQSGKNGQDLLKFTQIGIFGLKIYVPSGNTALDCMKMKSVAPK